MPAQKDCQDCRPRGQGGWCEEHKAQARRLQMASRERRRLTEHPQCFRCLSVHPFGERYCRLAAEYEGRR